MPKTSMHENDLSLSDHCQVRFSWQITWATTVPNSQSPYNIAYNYLGLRATGTNPPHYLAALFTRERIHFSWPNVGQNFDQRYHFGNLTLQFSGSNGAMETQIRILPVQVRSFTRIARSVIIGRKWNATKPRVVTPCLLRRTLRHAPIRTTIHRLISAS